jgi:eukaryotic-like serine/threonine-protein kinase
VGVTQEIEPGIVLAERFSVRDRLGSGGTATVFLAEDTVLCREVAIKRLHTSGAAADTRRFRREARLGASLIHPNLVTIFDTISGDDGLFIVMEYVRGRPLSEVIGPDGMDPRRALEVLGPIASALDYAHENGVVHRDVKPANVLISHEGIVKLVDLGTATADHTTQITTENQVMGTLAYIAPERLAGDSVGEPAADVYSLAVVAFEALTGRKPYQADSPAELLERIRHSPPPDLGDGRSGLAEVLAQGMDPDPDRRQASAGALVRDLETARPGRNEAASDRPLEPTQPMASATAENPAPQPFVPPPIAEGPRRRRLLLPALAVLALLAAGVTWLALSGGGGGGTSGRGTQAGTGSGSQQRSSDATASSSSSASAGTGGAGSSVVAAAPASASSETGAQLNDQGYALIQDGSYDEAVPVLRRAVAAFPEGTTDINYAYALYNLGHALRMAGHPDEAIPILEQRLRIPDQTETVQAELDAARAAADR